MIAQISRVGGCPALVLDQSLLDHLGVAENDSVEVTLGEGTLVVTPVAVREISPAEFERCLDRVVNEWGDVLARLAQ